MTKPQTKPPIPKPTYQDAAEAPSSLIRKKIIHWLTIGTPDQKIERRRRKEKNER